ncbi:MAG: GTP diphosphokinase [Gammaproteobacteria bacterium]|nr:GTP diphosphokinase [Gammaproteobacteria bacterium]
MPTPSPLNDNQTETAISAAVEYATTLAEKLLGKPPAKLVSQSREITEITATFSKDERALEAAALLPYLEPGSQHWQSLQKAVPTELAKLLNNLADLALIDELHQPDQAATQQEPLRRMLLAMVNDLRCVVIKLAQHLQQLRHAKKLSKGAQTELAHRSFALYAPLANRLGIWQLKWEIEDLGFRYSNPAQYKLLAKKLKDKRIAREAYIENAIAQLEQQLAKQNIQADVAGRPKHIFSIHKKMQSKHLQFEQLFDIRALRVLVSNDTECYMALGAVHSLWTPISGEFDDYLANPKPNGYRSIHTAVYADQGKTVEVQIRTQEMHEQAELGVAAHWRYKEGSGEDEDFNRKIGWLRELLKTSQDTDDDLIPSLTNQVFEDHIYVVTPAGDIIDLPAGATPIDFAFEVHTQVGYRCRGARVNGNIVPLNTRLNSGDQVEILTAKIASPSRDWLNPQLGYAATTKSRARLRSWFRSQDKEDNIAAGREILERELKRVGQQDKSYESLYKQFRKANIEALLASIGAGDISPAQIASQLQPKPKDSLRILSKSQSSDKAVTGVHIQGIGNLMSSVARCCQPVPGDNIVGFVTRGRGVSIHRQDCAKFLKISSEHQERVIDVCWGDESNRQLPVDIKIEAWDRHGLLRDISSVLANDHVNVLGIRSTTDVKAHRAYIDVSVEVESLEALSLVCSRVAQVPNVIEVERA